ncbi:uncharacterized protein METZ01_LOCUS336398, partial [marine metagenome]
CIKNFLPCLLILVMKYIKMRVFKEICREKTKLVFL